MIREIRVIRGSRCYNQSPGIWLVSAEGAFDPRSQTLFGNDIVLAVTQPERARPGFPTLFLVPTAKQSFATKSASRTDSPGRVRSQTESGNESKPTLVLRRSHATYSLSHPCYQRHPRLKTSVAAKPL